MFAIDDLGDAIDVTREFLTPVRLGTWLKLAFVVFFVGGIGLGGPTFPGGTGEVPTTGTETDPGTIDVGELLPILIGLALLVLLVWLAFSLVGAIFEFTLLESLRSGEVHVRRYTKRNFGRGLRLFGFRIVLGLAALLIVGLPLLAVFLSTSDSISLALLGLVVLFAIPVFLAYAVISRFTTVFVAPTMLQEDAGVIAAWKRFWPTLTANWTEYLVYLLLVWVLQMVIGFATSILLLVLLIPFAIVIIVLMFIPLLNLLVLLVAIPLFILLAMLVQVPIVTYLRYYALLVLGDTDADLDLIPDQRAAVRRDGPSDVAGPDRGQRSDNVPDSADDVTDRRDTDESDPWDSDDSGPFESRWDEPDADDRDDADDSSEDDDRDDRSGW